MDADLVRAAGQRAELDQGPAVRAGELAASASARRLAGLVGDHPPARLGARDFGQRQVDHALLARRPRRRPRRDRFSRPRRASNACWNARARLGIAREQQAARRVRSSRCIGAGGRWKPQLQLIEPAPRRCRRRRAARSTGRPAGLSITIASASMKRMRSSKHGLAMPCARRAIGKSMRVCGQLDATRDATSPNDSRLLDLINLLPSDLEWLMDASEAVKSALRSRAVGLTGDASNARAADRRRADDRQEHRADARRPKASTSTPPISAKRASISASCTITTSSCST